MTLLSIHLITYNNEKHIEDTLKSILKQQVDFKYEIVVGDDCSSDNTLEIINRYAVNNPSLFSVRKNESRLGILKNFKTTLDKCNGTFVFDIAGDDLLKTEDALQKMVNLLQSNNNLGFIDCGFDRLDDKDKSVTSFKNHDKITASKNDYKEALLLGEIIPIGHCYRKDDLYKFVDFDTYLDMNLTIEDYPILVDMVMNTDFKRINESLHIYRVHDDSHSHKKELKELVFQKKQMKKLFDYFSKKYEFSEKLQRKFSDSHYKTLLFLAGYFKDKHLGKDVFRKIKLKSLRDRVHYFASQNESIRNLISFRKKLRFLR